WYGPWRTLVIREFRAFGLRRWILLQQRERLLHSAFELRVVSLGDGLRVLLNFDIGRDAVVFHIPFTLRAEEAKVGSGDATAVHPRRIWHHADQPPPVPLADHGAVLRVVEHPGHRAAARPRHFVDDHHLRPKDRSRRRAVQRAITGTPPRQQLTV